LADGVVTRDLPHEVLVRRHVVPHGLEGRGVGLVRQRHAARRGRVEREVEVQLASHLPGDRKERAGVEPRGEAAEVGVEVGDQQVPHDLAAVRHAGAVFEPAVEGIGGRRVTGLGVGGRVPDLVCGLVVAGSTGPEDHPEEHHVSLDHGRAR
jgi:hypothetical protein